MAWWWCRDGQGGNGGGCRPIIGTTSNTTNPIGNLNCNTVILQPSRLHLHVHTGRPVTVLPPAHMVALPRLVGHAAYAPRWGPSAGVPTWSYAARCPMRTPRGLARRYHTAPCRGREDMRSSCLRRPWGAPAPWSRCACPGRGGIMTAATRRQASGFLAAGLVRIHIMERLRHAPDS